MNPRASLRILLAAATLLFGPVVTAVAQEMVRVRGTIDAFDGQMMKVTARDGNKLMIRVAEDARIAAVVGASLVDVKEGAYVGVAAMPQEDGNQRALEVLIFPEALRGVNEGFGPWDLRPQSTMTNATVSAMVSQSDGNTIKLKYKDGEKTIVIPADAPIVTYLPGSKDDLKPGAAIFIFGAPKQADGTLLATRVGVGRGGLVPPM